MPEGHRKDSRAELPPCVVEFIGRVTKKIGYRSKVRQEIRAELTAHFEDELRDCENPEERERNASRLIEEFGDAALLAVLCRRAKKRCRPLWVRVLSRTWQAVGVFLLLFTPYTIWFIRGKPNPTIDYLPQLNALNRPSGPVDDNAWRYYDRAMRLVVEPNEILRESSWFQFLDSRDRPLTSQEQQALADWIAINPLAWLQFEFAANRRHCYRTYRRTSGEPLMMSSIDDPPVAKLRRLVQLGVWKSWLAAERADLDEAIKHYLALARAAVHWQKSALLIEQLMGLAMTGRSCQGLMQMAAANALSPSQLSNLQTHLIALYGEGFAHVRFEGERLVMLDMIQRCFTRGGPGGGHRVVAGYAGDLQSALESTYTEADRTSKTMCVPLGTVLSMVHARRSKTTIKGGQIYDRMAETSKLSPQERRLRGIGDIGEMAGKMETWRYSLVYTLLPAERRVAEIRFQAKADHEGLVTVLAIQRYRLDIGGYPPDLETLVEAGYLKELPIDPFSDGPLVYRPVGDSFLLYSVGRDFQDNGGEPGRDKDGRPRPWRNNGDTVFWPMHP